MIEGMKCDGEQNKCLINFCVVQYDCFDGGFVIVWGVIFNLRVYGVVCMLLGMDQNQIYR